MKVKIAKHGGIYVDISNYIVLDGVTWKLIPVIAKGSGENLAGDTMRRVIKWKDAVSIVCVPLTSSQKCLITDILKSSLINFKITTDSDNDDISCRCIVKSIGNASLHKNGLWEGMNFELEVQ